MLSAPEHTLVVGPPKSGSSAVFSAIGVGQRRMGRDPWSLFEPRSPDTADSIILTAPERPLLVKVLTAEIASTVGNAALFGKRVMTVRDPRDLLISFLLFKPMTNSAIDRTTQDDVDRFVDLLRRKEADPGSLSVQDLCRRSTELGIGSPPVGQLNKLALVQRRFLRDHPAHVVRYEQFAASDPESLAALSDYLGYPVANQAISGSSRYGHIARSGTSGDFANWFLPSDLEHYNQRFKDYLRLFDYPTDVELTAAPVIDPARSSDYVASRSRLRRDNRTAMVATREQAWSPAAVSSADELERLKDYGLNGDAIACLRAAETLRSGHLGPAAPDEVLRWARSAAELGSAGGMRLVADLLEADAGDDPARNLELRRWQARYLTSPEVVRRTAREQVMSSTRFWAGSAVIDGVRHPRSLASSVREGVERVRRRRA